MSEGQQPQPPPQSQPRWRRLLTPAGLAPWRVRAGYAVGVLYFVFASPSWPSLVLGAMIASMGLVIRGAAAGYLQKNERLTMSGPYAYTRNPLYFGSALLAVGLLVAGNSWIAAVIVVAYVLAFYPAVMKFEEQHLRKLHGITYTDYAVHVPQFFPRLTPAFPDEAPFSWELYKTNREQQAAMGAGVAIVLLAVKMLLFEWWL